MEIKSSRKHQSSYRAHKGMKGSENTKSSPMKGVFKNLMSSKPIEQVNSSSGTDALPGYIESFNDAEQNFLKDNSISNFTKYKKNLKQLLTFLQKESTTKHSWQDRRRKKFHLIKVLDRSLYNLALQVLTNKESYKSTVNAVGEIRGLLIEIMA
jgi:uncharacterized protein YaaR (DUF327 family)